jgi:hypothetical protein
MQGKMALKPGTNMFVPRANKIHADLISSVIAGPLGITVRPTAQSNDRTLMSRLSAPSSTALEQDYNHVMAPSAAIFNIQGPPRTNQSEL